VDTAQNENYMNLNAILTGLFVTVVLMVPNITFGQNILQASGDQNVKNDTIITVPQPFYEAAEIAFQIENVNRYIKDKNKQIEAFDNMSAIDSAYYNLDRQISKEFEDFGSFNKLNLSKFFLLNTKRVWLSYRSQLNSWQTDISVRIQKLMDISDNINEKEKLWKTTVNHPANKMLPDEIKSRIQNSLGELKELESNLFNLVGKLSVLDSKIADQIFMVDQNVEEIDELHKNYRLNTFKATYPAIWNIQLKNTYEGTIGSRLSKVWYENTKSLKNSLPYFRQNLDNFITWCILIILIVIGLRYLYLKNFPTKRDAAATDNISELIILNPGMSVLYLVLFVFTILFNNIPLALSVFISLVNLIITFLLLRSYFNKQGRWLILTFIILLTANTVEIVFWYFGNYARLYLFLEAGLGILLVSHFIRRNFKRKVIPSFRYKLVVDLLRYPIFALYVIAFVVNLFGFQNLTVLFLKIGTQVSSSIIVIFGAWEISKSSVYVLFKVLNGYRRNNSKSYFPLLKKRLTLLLSLFFTLIWFHSFLVIVELDTPFYVNLASIMNSDKKIGSFSFTYSAIFHFVLIMLITWGLTSIIKILFSEGNFKRSQRLRGVPAAISMTLRIIIAMSGFFLALSGAGIDLTKITILLGAFGVGIGFGLQNIVSNFISGLILIYERPIQVGDTIEISALLGVVKGIGIRSSNVRTFDGAEVVVPNSILVSDQLINWTLSDDKRRIEIVIGVKYGTDPVKVIEILRQVANSHEWVAKDPEPRVLFNEFADSSLNFRLLFWVLFEQGIQTKSDISVAIDKAFKENNIEIPFPQLDLHVVDTPVEKETSGIQNNKPEDLKPLIADKGELSERDTDSDEVK